MKLRQWKRVRMILFSIILSITMCLQVIPVRAEETEVPYWIADDDWNDYFKEEME